MADSLMDFNDRCRLCIEPKRLSIDIFGEEGRRIKLRSKINRHLSLKISQSDGLPNQICYQCLFRLETWVSFKQLCMERDQVMKTWSQSYLDEASCEIQEAFNGGQNRYKSSKTRESGTSRSSGPLPFIKDNEGNHGVLSSANQMDDAKSDTSLWEVVKMDDTDNMEYGRQQKDIPQNLVGDFSSASYCILTENTNDEKHDWINRRKSQMPSKVPSSGSDSSNSNDVDVSSTDLLGHLVDSVTSTVPTTTCQKQTSNAEGIFPSAVSPPPLKRKRGRPSKAFLQRERELKKIRDQEKMIAVSLSHELKTESEKEMVDEEVTSESELSHNIIPHVVTSEFTPIERDSGSGVTEVVLDDPDFGSMKFTLSVVEVESPTSSPIPTDSYKYYNYASSSGNISSDSLHREDFEGFESPGSSCFMKSMLKDDASESTDEMPRSKSQDDVRSTDLDARVLPAGIKRKRCYSVSGDSRENCSLSDLSIGDQEEASISMKDDINSKFYQCAPKLSHVSKSLDNVNVFNEGKEHTDAVEERNAYSDGELSESPKKHFRRKSLVSKELDEIKH